MAWWYPAARARATLDSPPVVVMTVEPSARSSVINAHDTPDAPPLTSTVSPGTWPPARSAWNAVIAATGSVEASTNDISSGISYVRSAGAATNSAKPPGRVEPTVRRFSQYGASPDMQRTQTPQVLTGSTMTRAPIDGPTA